MIPDSSHTLGGIALPAGTRWINRRSVVSVGGQVIRRLSGGIDVYQKALVKGASIDLSISPPYSWLYDAKYLSLKALADVPSNQLTFIWTLPDTSTETYSVIFRHNDPPALDFSHVESPAIAINQGLWSGTIKLITV